MGRAAVGTGRDHRLGYDPRDRGQPRPYRGRGSGVEVEATGAQVWTIRDGKFQRAKLYQSKAEALEAVGLSE